MKITKLENFSIRPTEEKLKKAKKITEEALSILNSKSGLPKEQPLERNIYIPSDRDIFEFSKDSIEIAIDRIKR